MDRLKLRVPVSRNRRVQWVGADGGWIIGMGEARVTYPQDPSIDESSISSSPYHQSRTRTIDLVGVRVRSSVLALAQAEGADADGCRVVTLGCYLCYIRVRVRHDLAFRDRSRSSFQYRHSTDGAYGASTQGDMPDGWP